MNVRQAAALALAIVLVFAPNISWADYCVSFVGPGPRLIGRGFKVPKKGQCEAWVGFSQENGFNQPETGTGCTSSDGSQLSLIVTTAFPQTGNLETDVILLALPSQSGSYSSTVTEEGSVSWSGLNPGCAGNCAQGSTCSHGAIP